MYAQPVCAVQMSFYGIVTADYNGPLKQVNAHTDDDRYDMVELGAAGQSLIDSYCFIYFHVWIHSSSSTSKPSFKLHFLDLDSHARAAEMNWWINIE